MLAVHKWNRVYFGQLKSFHEAIFLACLYFTLHSLEPSHKIHLQNVKLLVSQNGTSSISVHWWFLHDITILIAHAELSAHTAPTFLQLVNADPNEESYSLSADYEIGCKLIRFDGACCFGLWSEILPRSVSVQIWTLALYIWNNPPASVWSGSFQGMQLCFSWPMSKRLTGRDMHNFLQLSNHKIDYAMIFVGHLIHFTTLLQKQSWKVFSFLLFVHFTTPIWIK